MIELTLNGITKHFPGVKALQNVELTVLPGEIHALCGENGAGKSTLMNVLSGNLQPDSGTIALNGREVIIKDPKTAFSLGISIVHQHLSLVNSLSVAENIFANKQPTNALGFILFRRLYDQTETLLKELGMHDIDPRTPVGYLSPATKQMIEIAKALASKPSVLILDEPTASLSEKETSTVFKILQDMKRSGTAVIYITHRLEEVYLLADKISVLKDGKYQGTFSKEALPKNELIRLMVGRDMLATERQSSLQREVLLAVKNLSGRRFHDVSFDLHRGEILGLAGLVGAGRTDIARAIFGIDNIFSGRISLNDKVTDFRHPAKAIAEGVAYVPEERKDLGLFQEMSIVDNVISANLKKAISGGLYDQAKAKQLASASKNELRVTARDIHQKVATLSGGNQQKVVLAKWLLTEPEVLIVDEPTHGIDVGAKFEIYEIMRSLAARGKGILVISSELPELLGLCDRILVIKKGIVAGEFDSANATEEKIMAMATD